MSYAHSIKDEPRALKSEIARKQRLDMLNLPHIAPLTAYVEELRKRDLGYIPYFDPMDGGINAKVLFLLEKPGRKTFNDPKSKRPGSGFISRNNDDRTAEATFNFMERAQIPRDATVIWNLIPGWDHKREFSKEDRHRGAACVPELMTLLPALRAVVFVGVPAAQALPALEGKGLFLLRSDHPSPIVQGTNRSRWENIPSVWAQVHNHL
jgi:hypothetical protein